MPEAKKFELSLAHAIVLAGIIIAAAIVATNVTATAPAEADAPLPSGETKVRGPQPDDHIMGSRDARLVLIEYSDFQCPFCARVHPTLKRLVDEGGGQVAWIYRHLPLESIHPQAVPAALASECVAEQLGDEGFWKFTDDMFANQGDLGPAYYRQVAQRLGADGARFDQCVASQKYASKVSADTSEATANGGQGTPYTILYTQKGQTGVSGALPYETFSAVIKAFLERQ